MDRNTKLIGVFGDSYADPNPIQYLDENLGRMPWPMWLEKLSGYQVHSHGLSATSTWYSYKQFLAHYKKYDTIVFCYSDLHRWHNINGDTHDGLYHIRYEDQLALHVPKDSVRTAQTLVDAYKILHDWDFDKFVFQSIFDSVNKLCNAAGIKLINSLNFEEINGAPLPIDITTTNNTVLTNLVQVSGSEFLRPNGSAKFTDIAKLIRTSADKRFCHLNPHNNKVLAEIILDSVENDVRYVNLGTCDRFSYEYHDVSYLMELN